MKRGICITMLFCILLTFTGCLDIREIGHTISAIAMAVDRGDTLRYHVTFQIEKTGSGAYGESETESGAGNDDLLCVEAPTLSAAYDRAEQMMSVTVSIENLKMVILSEDICRDGILEPITELSGSTLLKNNAFVVAAKGRADEVIAAVDPEEEEYLSMYYEEILFHQYQADTRFFLLETLYFNMMSDPGEDIILPLCVCRKEEDTPKGYHDDLDSTLIAGMIPKQSNHMAEFLGGAAFRDGKLCGFLSESEMLADSLLFGDFKTREISMEYPEGSGEYVVITMHQSTKPLRSVRIENGIIKENFTINLRGDYQFARRNESYVEFDEAFTKELAKRIEKMCETYLYRASRELNADLATTGKSVRRCFLTKEQFEKFYNREKLKTAIYHVTVNPDIHRAGRFIF